MRTSMGLAATALAAAAAVAGCGSSDGSSAAKDPEVAALAEHASAVRAPHRDSRPHLTGREILEIRLTGDQIGTSDVATYGDDGSAVLVRSYGGGGYYTFGCRLSAAELAAVRRDASRLPLDRAPKVRARARPTFYTIPAPSYVVERGRYVGSFTADAVPVDGRPMTRHIHGLMHGKEGHCSADFGQRTR